MFVKLPSKNRNSAQLSSDKHSAGAECAIKSQTSNIEVYSC